MSKFNCPSFMAVERLWPQLKQHVKIELTVDEYREGIW